MEIVAQQHDAHVRCAPASGATHSPSIRPSTRLCTPAPSYQCPEAEGIPPRRRPCRYLYSVHLKPNPNPSPNPNPNQVPVLCAPQAAHRGESPRLLRVRGRVKVRLTLPLTLLTLTLTLTGEEPRLRGYRGHGGGPRRAERRRRRGRQPREPRGGAPSDGRGISPDISPIPRPYLARCAGRWRWWSG